MRCSYCNDCGTSRWKNRKYVPFVSVVFFLDCVSGPYHITYLKSAHYSNCYRLQLD